MRWYVSFEKLLVLYGWRMSSSTLLNSDNRIEKNRLCQQLAYMFGKCHSIHGGVYRVLYMIVRYTLWYRWWGIPSVWHMWAMCVAVLIMVGEWSTISSLVCCRCGCQIHRVNIWPTYPCKTFNNYVSSLFRL